MSDTDEFILNPPDASRVAARALVLSAVCCRGLIEGDAHEPGAEELRQKVIDWLEAVGVAGELEPAETSLLSTPLGKLDQKTKRDAGWKSEGMVVLAWALGYAELPPVHLECEPSDTANKMGFLDKLPKTPLRSPSLRDCQEIETWADTYLTLHWRLRQFSSKPEPMDFVKFVSECTWGPLRLDYLETLNSDLAIEGVPVDKVKHAVFRRVLSITQERHQAFNWLLGSEPVYSQVTTDT
jgi:Domain of unknown function (DUF4272)